MKYLTGDFSGLLIHDDYAGSSITHDSRRENTGNKPKECAIKIRLPKHADDYGNLNLHNKRLLLLETNPDRDNTARNGISKKEVSLCLQAQGHTHSLKCQKHLWTDYSALRVLERSVLHAICMVLLFFISLNRTA